MSKRYLGIDIGGTNIKYLIADSAGGVFESFSVPTPSLIDPQTFALYLAEQFKVHTATCPTAVGVGCAGLVDSTGGVLLESPNLPTLKSFPLSRRLATAMGLPRQQVLLQNDANVAALGEYWRAPGGQSRCMVAITLGTGVGSGIIIDGRIWGGNGNLAGEIGHMTMLPGGPACNCGRQGCLEAFSSGTAISRSYQAKTGTSLSPKKIYECAQQGDAIALEVFRQAAYYLGLAIANLIKVLGPDDIVIGGGVAAGIDLLLPTLTETIQTNTFSAMTTRIRISQLGEQVGSIGAAMLGVAS